MKPAVIPLIVIPLIAALALESGILFAQSRDTHPVGHSQIQRDLPLTKFYDTPDLLPAAEPGTLIRSQEFDGYEIPFSISAIRILYHSRSAAGKDVAASGVVLLPYDKKPPEGGWPVIAWAHASTGVARACAPSLTRNIGRGPFLSMYVSLGYAVVAPDYAGLGTAFRNAFLDGPSNANDVIASIPAAHKAVPNLGTRWVVMGEEEGALTALAVAERENEIRDPNYLGAVAISNVAGVRDMYEHSSAGSSPTMLAYLAYGISTVYPEFRITDMLTVNGLSLYHEIEQSCSEVKASREFSLNQILKPGWQNNPFVQQYFDRNEPGRSGTFGPILTISGDAGPRVTSTTTQVIDRMCKQKEHVQWEQYADLEPERIIGDSVRDQIGWIEGRFAGRPAPMNCP